MDLKNNDVLVMKTGWKTRRSQSLLSWRATLLLYKCLFTLSKQRARHWAMRIGEPKSCGAASTKSQQQAAKITILVVEFIFKVSGSNLAEC